ncbi:MAG TPA: lipopolysaccharide biosynthesis protein [Ignavibacteria bacterium]|nr:lipopolysaccharide biosynthesis protein [Ignavibacteria bacterium]
MNVILKRISSVGFGNILGQAISLLSLPIIARLYSPESYSIWMLFFSIVLIFSLVATLRFELAILLPKEHTEALPIVVLCIVFTIISSLLSMLVVVVFDDFLYGESSAKLSQLSILILVMVFSCGIYTTALSWLTRMKSFNWYSFGCFGLPFFTVSSQLGMGYLGYDDYFGLVVGGVVGQAIIAFILFFVVSMQLISLKLSFDLAEIKNAFIEYQNYPRYMTPFTLLSTFRNRVVYFMLNNASSTQAGLYGMASRITNAPNSFLTGAVRPVFFQWAVVKNIREVEKTIVTIMKIMTTVIVPFWIIFILYSDVIVTTVLGERWREAAEYTVILSFPAIALLLTNWLDRSFDVLKQQKTAFKLELVFSCLVIITLFIGASLFEEMKYVIIMQSTVVLGYYWVWLKVLFNKAGYSSKAYLQIIIYFLSLSLVLFLIYYMIMIALPDLASFIILLILSCLIITKLCMKNIRLLRSNI